MTQTKVEAPFVANNNVRFKNLIINGDMSTCQREPTQPSIQYPGYYSCDRWDLGISSLGTWTMSQSTDVPTGEGFGKSTKLDCTTADASPSADDYFFIQQKLEGRDLQHLRKGTSSAKKVTVSFWVYATKTGTNILEFSDKDNTRHICQAYTISSSNTWEKKIITFDADTANAFTNDNGESAAFIWWLGCGTTYTSGTLATSWASYSGAAGNRAVGQVNHADSTSNNFYLAGVQVEAGDQATDFEFLPFDIQLKRCQRYFQAFGYSGLSETDDTAGGDRLATCMRGNSGEVHLYCPIPVPVILRATPTISSSNVNIRQDATDYTLSSITGIHNFGSVVSFYCSASAALNEGTAAQLRFTGASGYLRFSAEL